MDCQYYLFKYEQKDYKPRYALFDNEANKVIDFCNENYFWIKCDNEKIDKTKISNTLPLENLIKQIKSNYPGFENDINPMRYIELKEMYDLPN